MLQHDGTIVRSSTAIACALYTPRGRKPSQTHSADAAAGTSPDSQTWRLTLMLVFLLHIGTCPDKDVPVIEPPLSRAGAQLRPDTVYPLAACSYRACTQAVRPQCRQFASRNSGIYAPEPWPSALPVPCDSSAAIWQQLTADVCMTVRSRDRYTLPGHKHGCTC